MPLGFKESDTLNKGGCSADDAEKLVRGLGLIFSNTFLYGPTHSVTRQAVDDCYSHFSEIMIEREEVAITISEEGLFVDGNPVEQKNPLVRLFVTQVGGLELSSFSLTRGMPKKKFEGLIEIMNAKTEELKQLGGFASVVNGSDIGNIKIKTVTFRQVEEHEAVIDKVVAEKAAVAAVSAKVANVAEVVAFLNGEEAPGVQDAALKAVQAVATDSHKLAELIMQAAEVHKDSTALEDAKSFSKLVVDCMKRAYEGLLKDPSIKTQKGKKNLARTLLALEEQMLRKMSEIPGGLSDEDSKAIEDTIADMNDELKIDSLTDEFIKKKSAANSSEQRILNYLRKRGVDNIDENSLKGKLSEAGLSMDEWEDVLLKSGVRGGGWSGGDDVAGVGAAVGHLAALLVKMEEKFVKNRPAGSAGVDSGELNRTIMEVDQEVGKLVVTAEKKIEDIVETVKSDRISEEAGKPASMPRAKLMELLAEAVQELCQPLAVIHCSIDMMRSNVIGVITPAQKDLLDLAGKNSERVVTLLNKLMEISGVPKTLQPDAGIQELLT